MSQPLDGIRVLDFSTLLPGPLATLILAEAGADVVKVERPGSGEDLRHYEPRVDGTGAAFTLLNAGKRSLAINLKDPGAVEALTPVIRNSHVLVEQFRPGVMGRLGLGYEAVRAINPAIVYCSISGHGQSGPRAGDVGHDLNYLAETGVLALAADSDGRPPVPPSQIADIGGGSLPAVINILLALRQAEATGVGCHLDVSMTDNLFAWAWGALAKHAATGEAPKPGGELLTGGSPRYQVYPTADGGHLAVAALEQKFWDAFCATIGLPEGLHDDARDPAGTVEAVAKIVGQEPRSVWAERFRGVEACCSLVCSLEEALADPHFRERGLFDAVVRAGGGRRMTALPVPLAQCFRTGRDREAPELGAADAGGGS